MLSENASWEQMPRAFLTEGEREAVRDVESMESSTKSSHLSRVRAKLSGMGEDARILREHRPEIYEELVREVVEEDLEKRIERLENEVEELRQQVDS